MAQKHCRMTLSDPTPYYVGSDTHDATGSVLSAGDSGLGAPVWLIILVCIVAILVGISLFVFCSHFMVVKRSDFWKAEGNPTGDGKDSWSDTRFSIAVTDIPINPLLPSPLPEALQEPSLRLQGSNSL